MKPKYRFFNNTKFAIDGICDIFKNETSFKIEVIAISLLTVILMVLNFSILEKLFLLSSMVLILICEIINSAIERVVDLFTQDYHKLAKNAKDAGSACVFISIVFSCICWIVIFYKNYFY